MASAIDAIRKSIGTELDSFENKFKEAMRSKVPLLDKIMHYIVHRKGKQMRPMFVLLSARLNGGITEHTYVAASLVELLHTATLVHDDVVDESYERRGFFSINALWGAKVAVLVGDYLLAKGLLLSLEKKQHRLLELLSDAVKEMSEGELLQIEKARKLDIKEEIYFEIIRQKTASLISSACACGAASTGISEEKILKMKLFGEKIGIAFQIQDDLLDFGEDDIGKPHGIDIKEKKMTLPLIYALNQSSRSDKRRIINIVKNHNQEKQRVQEVIEFVRNSGGIPYAREAMKKYRDEAFSILDEFPENESKELLKGLVNYTIERTK